MERREFLETAAAISAALLVGKGATGRFSPLTPDAPAVTCSTLPLTLWGDGVHDDTEALQAMCDGGRVWYRGRLYGPTDDWLVGGERFYVTRTIVTYRPGHKYRRQGVIAGCQFFGIPKTEAIFRG